MTSGRQFAGRCAAGPLAVLLFLTSGAVGHAQWGPSTLAELSDAIRVDEADSATRASLERAKTHIAEQQWDEAIETLRQVMENAGGKLIKLDDRRYLSLRDFCHLQLASLPADGLALYRSRVDPLAKRWYEEAVAARDVARLSSIVEQKFASSWTDSALYALGELALEQADYARARWCWERISPQLRTDDGRPLWLALRGGVDERKSDSNLAKPQAAWLSYPDSDLSLADVRARLVLVSILEGALPRAKLELESLTKQPSRATGKLGGREVVYADALAALIAAAESSLTAMPNRDQWPTFAGAPQRTHTVAQELSVPGRGWSAVIGSGQPQQADVGVARSFGLPERRVAEDNLALLGYHPVVYRGLVLVNNRDEIFAFDLATGTPAWPGKADRPGQIFDGSSEADRQEGRTPASGLVRALGVPRYTLTVHGRYLLARMGSPITGRPADQQFPAEAGYVAVLDLEAQGKLLWKLLPDDARWAFEGTPVCDGTNLYVGMRYSDVRPQAHVACYDLQTGTRRWRRLVCAAESNARGAFDEITHNLLTLAGDSLYVNTNLGAVAAINKSDGQVQWLATYPRAKRSQRALHTYRDLNPAVYHRGAVYVAPSDFEGVLALDAATGQLLWDSYHPSDTVHLLGASGGNLLASGNSLWWINLDSGKVMHRFPDNPTLRGFGRGLLAGENVYWPARAEIRVFQAATGREVRQPIRLDEREPACAGGNLVAGEGCLVIATAEKLVVFGAAMRQAAAGTSDMDTRRGTGPGR